MRTLAEQMRPFLKPGAVVTDVGSVKCSVVQEIEPIVAAAQAHFVGSHPMAGSEKIGLAAARGLICSATPSALVTARPASFRRCHLRSAKFLESHRRLARAHDARSA